MALETKYTGMISSDFRNLQTSDGVLISSLWARSQKFFAYYNSVRNTLMSFMGYVTTKPEADTVSQVTAKWMRFSEHGTPLGRARIEYDIAVTTGLEGFQTAYGFTDFAELVALDAASIRAFDVAIAEENLRFRYMNMWKQFFSNKVRKVADILTKGKVDVLPFYYGAADTQVPPKVGGKTFTAGHQHFLRTATTAVITVADLDAGVQHVTEHGFDRQVYIFGSETTVAEILELGAPTVAIIQVTNPIIPADAININQAGALVQVSVAVNELFQVVGTYKGKTRIAIAKDVPEGVIGFFSHQGPLSGENPLQIREPADPQLRGVIRKRKSLYPFVEEYFTDFAGFGVRQRGNGVAMQWVYTGANTDPYVEPVWAEDLF